MMNDDDDSDDGDDDIVVDDNDDDDYDDEAGPGVERYSPYGHKDTEGESHRETHR